MTINNRLKDRLKTTKNPEDEKVSELSTNLDEIQKADFEIPVEILTKKILSVEDNAKLGAIVKEAAKFLCSLSNDKTHFSLTGNFDIGKKALISCLLSNILVTKEYESAVNQEETDAPKLIKKRKSLKEKLKRKSSIDD